MICDPVGYGVHYKLWERAVVGYFGLKSNTNGSVCQQELMNLSVMAIAIDISSV